MTYIVSAITALALSVGAFAFAPADDLTYTSTEAPAIGDVRDLNLEIPVRPWPEIERLRAELWAARQELARVRTERNELRDLFRSKALESSPIELFMAGYRLAGAPEGLLPTFVNGIVPCESGFPGRPDAATVVSGTNDVGFAQINMAAHRRAIEDIWPDMGAVASMQNPQRNGHFAGILANDSGTGPWYKSRHCWG